MSFVTLGDFFRQHLLQTHHVAEANKRAGDRKNERVQECSSLKSGTNDFRVMWFICEIYWWVPEAEAIGGVPIIDAIS